MPYIVTFAFFPIDFAIPRLYPYLMLFLNYHVNTSLFTVKAHKVNTWVEYYFFELKYYRSSENDIFKILPLIL